MRTFSPLAALVVGTLIAGGCSKPDGEGDGTPPPGALGGLSIEAVGASVGTTASRQNAQNIATAAAAVRAGGYTGQWASKEDAVADILRGISFQVGGRDVTYSAGNVGASDLEEAMAFLIFDPTPPGMVRFSNAAQP